MKEFFYQTIKFIWKRTLGPAYWGVVSWRNDMRARREIREADKLIRKLCKAYPLKVVIGSSNIYQPGWIPTGIENLDILDQNDWEKYFREDSIDIILAEHVWEHLTLKEAFLGAKNCYKYLKPGGYFRIAVPDGFSPDMEYIESVKPGGTGDGSDDHKMLYDHVLLSRILETAGFKIEPLEYFDASGKFHFREWTEASGLIRRSKRFDERNTGGNLKYTSLIIDAVKL